MTALIHVSISPLAGFIDFAFCFVVGYGMQRNDVMARCGLPSCPHCIYFNPVSMRK